MSSQQTILTNALRLALQCSADLLLHSAECCDRRAEEYRIRLQEVSK